MKGLGENEMIRGYTRKIRTDYRRCDRCGCSLDPGEGSYWQGEGRICEDCIRELEENGQTRKAGNVSGDILDLRKDSGYYEAELKTG